MNTLAKAKGSKIALTPSSLVLRPVHAMTITALLPEDMPPQRYHSQIYERVEKLLSPFWAFNLKRVQSSALLSNQLQYAFDLFDEETANKVLKTLDNHSQKFSGCSSAYSFKVNKVRDRIPTKKQYDRQLTDVYHKLPPGLRADTLHIFGLPLDVFCEDKKQSPSMMFVKSCFQQFGNITAVHVPGFEQMKKRRAMELSQKSKLEQLNKEVVGDVFLRFETYQGFVNAIESFRNKRWSRVLPDGSERTLDVEVDFDRCGHLTEAAIHERLQEVIRAEREEQAEKQRLIEEQQRRKKEELRLLLLSRIEEEKKELRQYRSLKMLCQAEHIVAGALKRVVEKLEEPASEPESLSEESEPEHEPAPEPEPESEPESAPSPPKQRTISPVFQIQIRADYKFPRAKK